MENEVKDEVFDEVNAEINESIDEAKNKLKDQDIEIEISDEKPKQEVKQENTSEKKPKPQLNDEDLSQAVQTRIKKIIKQKKIEEEKNAKLSDEINQLQARLEKIEKSNEQQGQNQLVENYNLTKQALTKAIEEGDTEAQVKFNEQLVDIKTAIALENQRKAFDATNRASSPTVGKAQQQATNPPPKKALVWWEENDWFNSKGFEKETAMARAIDIQLDIEGYDKENDDYYIELNNRLQTKFPELVSTKSVASAKPRQSRQSVAPTTGGQALKSNRLRMTSDQLRMARELGITEPEQLKKYAIQIQTLSRKDA
jgi:molybdopterin converting factor small subunit